MFCQIERSTRQRLGEAEQRGAHDGRSLEGETCCLALPYRTLRNNHDTLPLWIVCKNPCIFFVGNRFFFEQR